MRSQKNARLLMDGNIDTARTSMGPSPDDETQTVRTAVKLEFFGEEVLEKCVKPSGSSGKIYLPSEWIGRRVKVVKLE